ncbi:alpha-1,2-fucosyltransferase [Brevibacillus sp. GCM10020057]|uniref:alpha-1,2-fucosyltransferase n=1 Tax=Brevibacillus sp. GCM10020057 TaxID=3317327 RepID=UPI0036272B23
MASAQPVITMSTLGHNGRFGNQLFQYAFLKVHAKKHQLAVETPSWIGQYLFGLYDPPITKKLPMVRQTSPLFSQDLIAKSPYPYQNVDFWGYFQYHTSYYAPDRAYICSLFQPVTHVKQRGEAAMNALRSRGRTVIGIHLRRTDYVAYNCFVAPNQWYVDWLKANWHSWQSPVLFIASDDLDAVLPDFAEFRPVTSRDLGVTIHEASYYLDFYVLTQCEAVAISNSTFSFTASMLNTRGAFVRPYRDLARLVPFDPWNSDVLKVNFANDGVRM